MGPAIFSDSMTSIWCRLIKFPDASSLAVLAAFFLGTLQSGGNGDDD
jgi:hypothetical protein